MDVYNLALSLLFGFTILICILYLMMKQKTNENISLIWIFVAIIGLIQGLFPNILYMIHISNPPIFLSAAAIVFLLAFVFYLSSELSVAQSKINELSMHISLLNNDVMKLRTQHGQESAEDEI